MSPENLKPFENGKFWVFFERSKMPALVVTVDGIITATTKEFQELIGYTESELWGMPVQAITDQIDQSTESLYLEALKSKTRLEFAITRRLRPQCRKENMDVVWEATGLYDGPNNDELIAMVVVVKKLQDRYKIDKPVTSSLSAEDMKAKAEQICDRAADIHGHDYEKEDKRPLLTRIGRWVIEFVASIKDLTIAQCTLVGFLAFLALLGYIIITKLETILQAISK